VTEPARTPASLPDLSQAAAGARHSLALTSGGKLYAWGKNDLGQLGNNTTADSLDPVRVLDSSGSGYLTCVSRAAAGFDHNLALRHDGTVWSWGGNVCGQLGNNTRTASPLPVQVLDASGSGYLTDVTQIAAGDCCSMALKSDGSVYAWGGYVQDVNPVLPVKIKEESGSDLGGVTQIAIGGDHCLALKSDGTVRAWGFNMDGQLGNNSTDRKYRAVQVLGLGGSGYLTDVTQVAAGASHSMALKSDGSVYAWGANFFGTLGNNTQTESHVPVQVLDASGSGYLAGVTQISAGFDHSLALKSDGSLWGWGDISSLGVGETGRVQKLPVQSRMSSAVALARGPVAHHAIALKAGLVNLTMAVSKSSYGTTSPEPGTSSVYSHTAHQITATPTGKYSFGNWTVSGGASVANANAASTTVILTADGSVTANFLPPVNLTMLLNPEEGGSVSPGSGTVKIGESFDITVTPADKYSFQKWTCSGGASVTDANSASTRAVLSSEGAITANFNAPPVLIMAVNPAQGGTVSPAAGTSPVTLNQEFDISAAPADKYLFQVWTVSGGASVTNANSTATRAILRSGGKITANFLKPSTLTMAVNPAQSGSVTPAAGTSLVRVGDTFDITATPADKCSFQKWTCSGGASVTDANSATTKATMSAVDGVITANFLPPATLTMSVNPEAGGSASPASGSFRVSESFNITATPADKYTFQKWTCSGGASVANANAASTTAALSSDGAITACFNAPVSLTMAANPAAAGTTSPVSGKSVVPFNTGFAVTATPATAYGFLEWTAAGGASVADTNTASTTATLTADGVITAKFAPLVSLTMGINNSKCGTVSPEKGVHSVAIGKRLAFTASSFDKDRYIFQNWTVSGGVTLADTGSASTTGTVTAEGAVTANFTAYANLTVKNDDGRGNVTPSGTSKVLQDTPISISAAAKDAYAFAGWSCAGAGAVADTWKGSTTVTLTGDCSVTAAFASGDWLTVSPIMMPNNLSGGTTAPNGGVLIPFNSAYPISATPNTGYRFDQWVVSAGDAKVADIGSASTTVTMTSGQSTVLARFKWSPSSDFNADGRSDMIFFNTNGSLVMYYMDGGTLKQWVIPSLGDGEIPIATGDFNGDGCADILTRNTAKDTASVFLMRGTSVLSSAVLTSGVSDWRVAGTGDFNGDGKCDIIWQHTSSGAGVIYLMSGLIYTNWGFVYESSDTANWQIKAVGDLDGDGKADIIWRNKSTGVAKAYLMNGVTVKSSGQIYDGADPKWNIAGAGDLDGDGKADIIWRHSVTGVILGYLMDGLLLKSWAVIYDGSNPNLRFAGVGDYSGEGKTDIALRDIITGNVYIFVMDGLRVTAQNCVYDGGDPNWYVSGQGESSFAILISSASGPGTVTPSAGTHRVALDEPVTIKAVPASASCRFIGWTVSGGGVIASAGSVSTTVTLSGDASVKAWFTAAAVADLNGDGKSDILWRNSSNGSVAGWLMSGARSTDARIIFDSDASWIPAGKADFNGDGKADILWRNSSSGSLALWLMSGLGRTDGIVLPASVSETVAGIGDFNGDGKADILKLASDGAVYMELMNGASVISRTKIFEPGQDWIPCGTGDFDGDGKSDILWRHASGTVAMWLMDGVTAKNGRGIFLDDSQGWRPKACGDFNGDGKCDIVWQDASGNAVVWLMSGFSMTSYGYIFQNGDTAWKIMESGDFDGDGKADILWRNSSTGQTVIYFMNGASVRSWAIIFDGDTNWTVAR
jgi:alpha-tubulin suppressor-like RCC1 family protein